MRHALLALSMLLVIGTITSSEPQPRIGAAQRTTVAGSIAIDAARPLEVHPVRGEAEAAPLVGAADLRLGKDKTLPGYVKLSWSGGSATYVVKRWDNLVCGGTPAMTTPVALPSFDDDSLYNGLNGCWIVD